MSDLDYDAQANLPCPVCKGTRTHHRDCSVPVLGVGFCRCEHTEVDQGVCVQCRKPYRVGGAV